MLRVVVDDDASTEMTLALDEICREGARRMLGAALEAERDAYLASLADERDERRVLRRGRHRATRGRTD